jgi:hypothetical protein
MNDPLTGVETRILDELLRYHTARSQTPAHELLAPRSVRQPMGRRRMIETAVVWTAILVVGVVLVVRVAGRGGSALAAIPAPLHFVTPGPGAPSGRQELLRLARAAARQPATPSDHPRYAYTETRGWYLDSSIGGGHTSSWIANDSSQSWLAPDGSGRGRTVRQEPDGSRNVDDFRDPAGHPLLRLSTDEAVLARQIARGWPMRDGPVERFVALTDLTGEQPIGAHAESTMLRLLARTPGLINSGTVIDRAGRHGVAVSLNSAYTGLPTRYTYIFDPHTGRLLGEEETLTGNTGKLNVPTGSVISYTTYLASGWVATTSSTPTNTR